MGCCQTTEDQKEAKKWDKELAAEKRQDQAVKKTLFLGSGASGKSTLFKQLRTLYGTGYGEKDRLQFRDHIFAQIVEQMKNAIEMMETLKEEEPEEYKDMELSTTGKDAAEQLRSMTSMQLTPTVAEYIGTLWKEEAIRLIYDQRATTKIDDSCAYFWDHVHRISEPNYVPNDDDILLVRYRTTGVIEQKFTFKKNIYHCFDVGGQKSERKKWIHCFEMLDGCVYIVSLSGYDEVMFEDEEKNIMDDSIELFEQLMANEYFKETKVFLVFNKTDLFAEKIERIALSGCGKFAAEYDENVCYNECKDDQMKLFNKNLKYIKHRFYEVVPTEKRDDVHVLVMCATDKDNVQKQFEKIAAIMANEEDGEDIKIVFDRQNTVNPDDFIYKPLRKSDPERHEDIDEEVKISKSDMALRMVGKVVYFLVMAGYGLHILLLYPILYSCYKTKLKNSAWLFEKIPIEDSINATSILLTTTIILLIVHFLDIYPEIQSWMIAYMTWCIYVVLYLYNRACTVYAIFSDRELRGIKTGNVKALNVIIKYVVGVEVDNAAENNYTRLLAVIGGLFPALLGGLIANYFLEEKYILKCSKEYQTDICEGPICCKMISSHDQYFYEFIGVLASRIIAAWGIVRIIGWLFCKGHPELRDIAQKMKKDS